MTAPTGGHQLLARSHCHLDALAARTDAGVLVDESPAADFDGYRTWPETTKRTSPIVPQSVHRGATFSCWQSAPVLSARIPMRMAPERGFPACASPPPLMWRMTTPERTAAARLDWLRTLMVYSTVSGSTTVPVFLRCGRPLSQYDRKGIRFKARLAPATETRSRKFDRPFDCASSLSAVLSL
jgi:hypothetical protein